MINSLEIFSQLEIVRKLSLEEDSLIYAAHET
jgi:hypothetical protein